MDINDLTIGQAKELSQLFGGQQAQTRMPGTQYIGQNVIIRTYSAGVWFGVLAEKSGNEVILKDARRMWKWWAAKGISLSGVAVHGINCDKSKIATPVENVWLEAIEIIPTTWAATASISGADHAEAE